MPITPFLRGQAFDPETVEVMGKAFVLTREALGLSDRTDARTLVAEKIIKLAQRGFKNPLALHLAAMTEFESDLHSRTHRLVQRSGAIVAIPILVGLHHQYVRM